MAERLVKRIEDQNFDIDAAVDELVAGLEGNADELVDDSLAKEDKKGALTESAIEQRYRFWQSKLRAFEQCRDQEKSDPRKCNALAQAAYEHAFSIVPNNAAGIDKEWHTFDECAANNSNDPRPCSNAFRDLWKQYTTVLRTSSPTPAGIGGLVGSISAIQSRNDNS